MPLTGTIVQAAGDLAGTLPNEDVTHEVAGRLGHNGKFKIKMVNEIVRDLLNAATTPETEERGLPAVVGPTLSPWSPCGRPCRPPGFMCLTLIVSRNGE